MGRFKQWLNGLFPDEEFGFAVVGTEGLEAVANDGGDLLQALDIEVIGEWKLDDSVPNVRSRFDTASRSESDDEKAREETTRSTSGSTEGGTPERPTVKTGADQPSDNRTDQADSVGTHADRFDRNIRAFGAEGQRRLADATVGIVGVGGLGSIVAEQLVRMGVTDVVLVDPDFVEESNLSRLVGVFDHHIGKPKVTAIREHLWKSGSANVDVEIHQQRVQDIPAVLDRCDVVVGCVDSITARSFCNEYAVKHLTYYVDAGVRIDVTDEQAVTMTGYVHLVAPGSNACFDCLGRHNQDAARIEQLSPAEREVERERGYINDEQLEPEPAVIHLNGSCASKAVSVVVDLITGRSVPPDLIRYEDTENEIAELTTDPSSTCPTCGDGGVLGVGRRRFGDAQFEPETDQDAAISD
jgi:molybdopterin/thiamine biosynthesis adenylyltransferase